MERCKGLVEPQVIPPSHRDEISVPHVRKLVRDRSCRAIVRGGRAHGRVDEHVLRRKRYESPVFLGF